MNTYQICLVKIISDHDGYCSGADNEPTGRSLEIIEVLHNKLDVEYFKNKYEYHHSHDCDYGSGYCDGIPFSSKKIIAIVQKEYPNESWFSKEDPLFIANDEVDYGEASEKSTDSESEVMLPDDNKSENKRKRI